MDRNKSQIPLLHQWMGLYKDVCIQSLPPSFLCLTDDSFWVSLLPLSLSASCLGKLIRKPLLGPGRKFKSYTPLAIHSNPHSPSPLKHLKTSSHFRPSWEPPWPPLKALIMCIINIFILSWYVWCHQSWCHKSNFRQRIHFHSVWGAVTVSLSQGRVMGDNLKAVCLSPMWTGIWSFLNYDSSCVWQIFKSLAVLSGKVLKGTL